MAESHSVSLAPARKLGVGQLLDLFVGHHRGAVRNCAPRQARDQASEEDAPACGLAQQRPSRVVGEQAALPLALDDVQRPHREPRQVRAQRPQPEGPETSRNERRDDVAVDGEGAEEDGVAPNGHSSALEQRAHRPWLLYLPGDLDAVKRCLNNSACDAPGDTGDCDLIIQEAKFVRRRLLLQVPERDLIDTKLGRAEEGSSEEHGQAAAVEPNDALGAGELQARAEAARLHAVGAGLHPRLNRVQRLPDHHGGEAIGASRNEADCKLEELRWARLHL
mmetsp:Transcript_83514/g.270036  ORF Transcript_83514/g.270036 Transcript_83514/m.270036 type:complete len:278 (+) Transcript_83514:55-888(+)